MAPKIVRIAELTITLLLAERNVIVAKLSAVD